MTEMTTKQQQGKENVRVAVGHKFHVVTDAAFFIALRSTSWSIAATVLTEKHHYEMTVSRLKTCMKGTKCSFSQTSIAIQG